LNTRVDLSDPRGSRLPWPFLIFLLGASFLLATGLAWAEAQEPGAVGPVRRALGLAPCFAAVLALFHPQVPPALRALGHRRVAGVAAAIAAWTMVVPATRFDPYWLTLVALWAAVPIMALRADPQPRGLTSLGLCVWLVWWIPFDLRWYDKLWKTAPGSSYEACALLVTMLAGAGFGALSTPDQTDLRAPTPSSIRGGALTLVAFGAIAIPLGAAVGFLHPHGEPALDARGAFLRGFGLLFTVALPEELFFRGVLDAGLRARLRSAWVSLAISSFAFGLMHWNNKDKLASQLAYLLLASVAGIFYGLAYRRWGLWAAVICHALVDLVWKVFLV
jgi:membrane protease YdiL (CAAX protease family)